MKKLKAKSSEVYVLLGVLAAIIVLFGAASGGALFSGNILQTFAFQFPEFGLLALGMMVAILTGGINMSLVSTAALAGILGAMVLSNPALDEATAITMGIAVCVGSACLMGALNGAIIACLNVPPMLVTIGTMTLFEGISLNLTEGGAISGFPETFFQVGSGSVLGIPIPLLLFIAMAEMCIRDRVSTPSTTSSVRAARIFAIARARVGAWTMSFPIRRRISR